ncbi:hypothetical protein CWO85_00685 [Candidatus Phytoplasma ziziphi]|uniref:Uncharacterized protein n=1 Tax=Ziziphus jujuba witches'-broom phytoplasma TaxID=135727 RepID=A0A660HMP6_ZIZJU|nr:hypothetical protein [Candidatus Phytoplasma ziziphi]AYJ01056.1 hypothetical protein CWO85_00685 [Candidatus Phytoplasma ziziphi]
MKINQNQVNTNKLKIFIVFFILTIIFSVIAVSIYFSQKRKDEIKLESNFPIFKVELLGGNNQNKYLIPFSIPNLNKDKYEHLINIEHSVILSSQSMEIKDPLFLKIEIFFDTQNTFQNPEKYFDYQIITTKDKEEAKIYSPEAKPQYSAMHPNETQTIKINTQIQQKDLILAKNPKLFLVYDYELVDKQGKIITGGSNIVSNKTSNIVHN